MMMNTSEEEKNEDEAAAAAAATSAASVMQMIEDRGEEIIIRDPLTKMYQQHQQHQHSSMSPRIPRKEKRLLPTSYSKEDDYDYELTTTGSDGAEMKPLMMNNNMLNNHAHNSPSVVITSPNSPLQHRSYSGGGGGGGGADIGSPSNNSGSCSGSYAVPTRKLPPMVVVDIEGGNSGGREGVEGDESKDGGLRRRRGEEGESTTEEGEEESGDNGGNGGGRRKDPKDPANIDVSLYTTKKNVAQGMLDIALLSANCSQLKYLLFHYERDTTSLVAPSGNASSSSSSSSNHFMDGSWFSSMDFYFIVNLVCIGISISLQVIVGILLILNGRHNVYVRRYQRVADSYSNLILVTVFIITIVNIFLSVFISAR